MTVEECPIIRGEPRPVPVIEFDGLKVEAGTDSIRLAPGGRRIDLEPHECVRCSLGHRHIISMRVADAPRR